jgi:hypothetical protein
MKQKDLLIIAVAVIIAGTISYVLSNKMFGGPKNRNVSVQVVEPITTDFNRPNDKYINNNSINPTQIITIGGNQATQPAR